MSVSGIGMNQRANLDTMLLGIVNDKQDTQLRHFYRDIYNYDSVAGSAVDFSSTLPFSDLSLTGCPEDELEIYTSAIERLQLKNNHAFIRANELIFGEYCATLVFDERAKNFTDMIPYELEQCTIQYSPFTSIDPVVTVRPDKELRNFLESDDEQIIKLRKHIPQKLISNMLEGDFQLDPLTTLYLGRFTHDRNRPTSYYRRILPIYLLEKLLFRGTLVETSRRMRAALHVQAGLEGVWEPTAEEMTAITELFQKGDLDPLGPIITTRNGINTQEIRQGGDFFKITDIYDQTTAMKLRGLNISESFLSGDINYATAEVNLTVYLENLKYDRNSFTQRLYYNKLFPVIAAIHKFKHDDSVKQHKSRTMHYKVKDASQYRIPKVHWHKSLEPMNDQQAIEMLNFLSEKGVPIPLRMFAAASGLSLEQIESELDDDLEQRKVFAEYQDKVSKELGGDDEGGDDGFDGGEQFASALNKVRPKTMIKPKILGRDYGDASESFTRTVTGKKQSVVNQSSHNAKIDLVLAKAIRNLRDPHHYNKTVKKAREKGLIK